MRDCPQFGPLRALQHTELTPSDHHLTILLARLDGSQVGFPASAVGEIVRAVAITALPGAPPIIEGTINLRGRIVPVVDLRHRLGMPAVALAPEQYLVALTVGDRVVVIRVDDVYDVADVDQGTLSTSAGLSPTLRGLAGIAATPDGLVVIHDVDSFLTDAEASAFDQVATAATTTVAA